MPGLTDRGKDFRSAIAGFIEARRAAKEKERNYDPAKYVYGTWLADAASRAHNLKVVTHPIKFTHSAIKGATSIHFGPDDWIPHSEIGTHSLAQKFEEDFAITDAKHLDVYSLLMNVTVEGKQIIEWIRCSDQDLACALHDNPDVACSILNSFRDVINASENFATSALAKQVYWLQGDDPTDDNQYHLLQPMFSSSLEHAINRHIQGARNSAFEARGTKKQKPTYANHHTYPNLVARSLGGSNAQNVSPMNKVRGGVNYLLPSLPPPTWEPRGTHLLKQNSIFDHLLWFGGMRELVGTLIRFLKSDPEPTRETRNRRETIEQAIDQELAMFGVAVRGRHEAGWTRDPDCRLPTCERLWLDPDRTELPLRDASEHPEGRADDEAFNADYARGDWADEVAERFGNWLNARLRDRGLVTVALPERNHWVRQAVLDVAWPVPMKRRARGGAA